MKKLKGIPAISSFVLLLVTCAFADNPFITDQFTADPTARLFEGKIYVYPSHDMASARSARGGAGWFAMEDYHVFSSANLLDWTDHGVIVDQKNVEWVNTASNAMWAPDCVFRNGKYYFYFPAPAKAGLGATGMAVGPPASVPSMAGAAPTSAPGRRGARGPGGGGGGNRIGVAIADKPGGPFKPEPLPIQGIGGIDPCVLIDKDGQAYLYVSQGRISVAKLKPNMIELDGAPQVVHDLPTQGLIEGPFVFERNGIYYMTYPHAVRTAGFEAECLEYAMGSSPMGPFKFAGIIMDQSESKCWTNHHSLVEYKGQWILFYHDKDLSPDFDKNRSIRADYLSFNADGTIQKVIPTLRGVGTADAKSKVQIDRYSAISKEGTSVSFLNDADKHAGWKTTLKGKDAWVQYNRVDFGTGGFKQVNARAVSSAGAAVAIRLDKADGPLLARVRIGTGSEWTVSRSTVKTVPSGMHDVVISNDGENEVDVDWVSFE